MTSSGDLQIVQVHRSDSGTYVCVADNGIGAPVQREVTLNVAGMLFYLLDLTHTQLYFNTELHTLL